MVPKAIYHPFLAFHPTLSSTPFLTPSYVLSKIGPRDHYTIAKSRYFWTLITSLRLILPEAQPHCLGAYHRLLERRRGPEERRSRNRRDEMFFSLLLSLRNDSNLKDQFEKSLVGSPFSRKTNHQLWEKNIHLNIEQGLIYGARWSFDKSRKKRRNWW